MEVIWLCELSLICSIIMKYLSQACMSSHSNDTSLRLKSYGTLTLCGLSGSYCI